MRPLLFLFCILELLFTTWLTGALGSYVSPLVVLGLSLGIAILFLKIAVRTGEVQPLAALVPARLITLGQWALFLGISCYIIAKLQHLWAMEYTYHEVGKMNSDVIPQITTLVERFLHGEQPYYPIKFTEYSLYPTYLPFQWMPYIPLQLLNIDLRWLPTMAMWAACCYFFLRHRKTAAGGLWDMVIPIWPLVLWAAYILHDNRMFIFLVEGLIAGYYFLAAESIKSHKAMLIAISVSLCLLSRYSIIFWVPLCMLLHFASGKRRDALVIAAVAIGFFLVFYWLPFLRRDASVFINGYTYHTNAAHDEWLRDIATHQGKVYLYNGLGFTSFAMLLLPGNEGHILMLYKNIHLFMCALTILVLALMYIRNKDKYPLHTFLLFSFKVYLTIFYAFIQIPYKYLFFVPVVVSLSLLGAAFRPAGVKEKQTFVS